MTEWHRVVFSDESRFCLSSDSRRVRVWRRRGERSNPAAIVERPTVRQRGIMVWGAIAYDSRSPLLRIQGTMTAQRYVDDVLRPVTLPYLQGVPNALYQQDNARPHTARISQQALQDVQMLPWPPYSPDLSPIEHVWDIIERRLHALPQLRSEDELWQMVEREWRAIPQDAIRTLIDSLPRRVAACIAIREIQNKNLLESPKKTSMAANLTPPLPMNINASNLFAEYKQWMESYAIFEIASGISKKSDEIKRATLLHCLGPNVQRIFLNLPDEKENYEQTKMALDKYFTPYKNVVTERFKFRQRVQKDDESIDNYLISLRELSKSCEFGNLEADMIRDQIIEKCNNKKLKEKLLQQENLTLSKTIDIARMLEISRKEIRLLEPQNDQTLNIVQNKPKKYYNANNFNKSRFTNQGTPSFSGASKPKFYRCGLDTHSAQECGAKKMTCSYCNKLGHLFRACRNRPNQNNNRNHKSFNQTKVKTIQEENKTEVGESSDEYTYYTGAENKEKVQIDGSEINMIIDTGSDRTFISYNKMLELYGHKIMPKLHDTTRTFFAYGQDRPLPCYGYFNAVISWKENSVSEEIYVIDKKVESLLGGKASFELGIIKRVNHVNESMSTNIETLVQEHEHLFHGLGTIKGYSHKVTLKDNYRPIAQRCRRIPYAMVEAVNQELDKMLENGIIEEVHQGSEWVSNIIVVPKRDSEEIRLCIDLREVNKAILRERHPIPTIDNMLHALKGAKVFAKLDAKKGFWQVDLDPQSRPLTTFITHRGCYRFCKVPFGLSSAPEAYQKGMDSILLDLKGVICYLDDVVVYAKDRQELEERLRKVLQRFDKVGIRLNRNKCKFAMEELDIFGHIVSSEGIKPDNRKIEAVLNFPIPKNIEMLRSFLGTCGFLRKFIPNFSKLAEPLNNLTRKNVRWNWDLKTNKAFQDLKESLTKEPCLAYYNLNSPTELITDASPIGLGAVLIQTQQNGIKRPIAYASRSLTDTEKRYSQIEKETLGFVWAIEHFNTYIWGRKFVLKTDHKPLIYMLNPKNGAVLPPRIQRLSWRLQPYDFEIEFIQGKQNIADIFSRQPLSNTSDKKWLEDYVHKVLSITSEELQALSLKEIKVCTEQDPLFQKLKEMVEKGVWPYPLNEEFKCFYKFKDELSIFDNLILKGSRILLPSKLIKRVLRIAHETHQGMTRTKQLLREKYFWINMDFDIENLIRNCPICVRNQPLINDQPLQIVPLPSKPWMKLGIDIVGPIGHHYVLTVIDYYSSYPEAMIIEDISSKTIIEKLMENFARHGYPHEVVTDNGLQFVSTSMERFLKECGIKHIKASPYYPKRNGKIERFHRFLKKQFNSSSEEGKDWKEDLSRILMSYRTTPNRSTGKTPAFLLFSREIKTKLSSLVNDAEEDESNIKEFNMVYKEKMKTYNDIIRKASPHNFEIGNLVYVANPNNGKLDSNFRSEHHVILENTSINSFKLVNTKNGKIIHRNAKHLKHVPTQETNQDISDLIPEESQKNLSSDSTRIEHLNSSDVQITDDNSSNQDKDTSLNRPSSSRTGFTFNPVVSDRLDAEVLHQLPPEKKGKVTHATAKGDIKVSTCTENGIENVHIKGVLHVPNLRSNLLSIYELTNKGNTVIFNRDGAKIYNEQDDLIAEAQIQDRMYVMETRSRDEYSEKTENVMTTKDDFSNDNISLWHRRLNHLNEAYMKEIIQRNVVLGFNVKFKNLPECEACIMGKLTRQPYHPVTTNCTTKPLELVHMDLCVSMPYQSLGGSKYLFVLVDDSSRRTFIYFLKNKDETLGKFEEFKARVENELNLKIKDVRTDNGTEFTNHRFKNFLIKNGIHHQLSTAYSPQSNGVAERVNRTLIETARTLLFDSGLPMAFWAEAVATASYVKNCTPHRSIKLDTPMEKWKGRKPYIRHLRIFGCLAFWPITQQHRCKFMPKSQKVIRKESLRAIVALAAQLNLFITSYDVKTAYLYGELKQTIFMKQPEGFVEKECRCNQSDVSTCGSAYPSTSSGGPTSHLYRHPATCARHPISFHLDQNHFPSIVSNGLHSCRPLRRLPLTPPNRRQRLEWCRARSTWMTEWHRVVFSDESRFCLSSNSRRVRVWRRRGERSNRAAIVERHTVRQRGIMVWGAIAYDSRSPLLRIQGTMTAQRYVDDVLRPVTLPYFQGVPNALYQQHNARPHTARISQQALQDVQMLPWPPYSPDLLPIEHVWDIIGRRLHALPQPRSEDELWQMVEREWRAIPQDAIRTLIDSLPRRVAACIAVRETEESEKVEIEKKSVEADESEKAEVEKNSGEVEESEKAQVDKRSVLGTESAEPITKEVDVIAGIDADNAGLCDLDVPTTQAGDIDNNTGNTEEISDCIIDVPNTQAGEIDSDIENTEYISDCFIDVPNTQAGEIDKDSENTGEISDYIIDVPTTQAGDIDNNTGNTEEISDCIIDVPNTQAGEIDRDSENTEKLSDCIIDIPDTQAGEKEPTKESGTGKNEPKPGTGEEAPPKELSLPTTWNNRNTITEDMKLLKRALRELPCYDTLLKTLKKGIYSFQTSGEKRNMKLGICDTIICHGIGDFDKCNHARGCLLILKKLTRCQKVWIYAKEFSQMQKSMLDKYDIGMMHISEIESGFRREAEGLEELLTASVHNAFVTFTDIFEGKRMKYVGKGVQCICYGEVLSSDKFSTIYRIGRLNLKRRSWGQSTAGEFEEYDEPVLAYLKDVGRPASIGHLYNLIPKWTNPMLFVGNEGKPFVLYQYVFKHDHGMMWCNQIREALKHLDLIEIHSHDINGVDFSNDAAKGDNCIPYTMEPLQKPDKVNSKDGDKDGKIHITEEIIIRDDELLPASDTIDDHECRWDEIERSDAFKKEINIFDALRTLQGSAQANLCYPKDFWIVRDLGSKCFSNIIEDGDKNNLDWHDMNLSHFVFFHPEYGGENYEIPTNNCIAKLTDFEISRLVENDDPNPNVFYENVPQLIWTHNEIREFNSACEVHTESIEETSTQITAEESQRSHSETEDLDELGVPYLWLVVLKKAPQASKYIQPYDCSRPANDTSRSANDSSRSANDTSRPADDTSRPSDHTSKPSDDTSGPSDLQRNKRPSKESHHRSDERIKDPVGNVYSRMAIADTHVKLLRARTKGCYSKIRILSKTVKDLICILSQHIPARNMAELQIGITSDIKAQDSMLDIRHRNKLSFWSKKYKVPLSPQDQQQSFLNLSSFVPSPDQVSILSKGLKHRYPSKLDKIPLIAGIETSITGLNMQDKHSVRNHVISVLNSPTNNLANSHHTNQIIRTLSKNNNIVITRSDKGSRTVIMNTSDYISGMNQILSNSDVFTPATVEEHTTSNSKYKKELRTLCRNRIITTDELQGFLSNLHGQAYIYGLPK
ncbi:K02A2.6-like, partial [Cordylochernes scorpioides]